MSELHVLVVCHGNVCRSPLATAVLQRELGEERVRGCGVSEKASKRQLVAKKVRDWASTRGIDLNGLRSQGISFGLVHWATHIVYMDNGNRERLNAFWSSKAEYINLGEVIGLDRIRDPAFLKAGGNELNEVLQNVIRASVLLAQRLKSTNEKTPAG